MSQQQKENKYLRQQLDQLEIQKNEYMILY